MRGTASFPGLIQAQTDFWFQEPRWGCSETHCHLLQEAGDILLAALGPRQRAGIVLELARHDERVPAHRLAVVFPPVVLDAEAAGGTGYIISRRQFLQGENTHGGLQRHLLTKGDCEVGEG